MTDFRNVDATDFARWSFSEVRAFARGLSSSGIAADARAIGKAGERLSDSIAELERDVDALRPRWQGEAGSESFDVIGRYAARSYRVGISVEKLVARVQSLSSTASTTNRRFAELPDPVGMRGIPWSNWAEFDARAEIAAALQTGYSTPVAGAASTMPLSERAGSVSFTHIGRGSLQEMRSTDQPGPPQTPGTGDAAAASGDVAPSDSVLASAGGGDTGDAATGHSAGRTAGSGGPGTPVAEPRSGDPQGAAAPSAGAAPAPIAAAVPSQGGPGAPWSGGSDSAGDPASEAGAGDPAGQSFERAQPVEPGVPGSLLAPAASVPSSPPARGTGTAVPGMPATRGGDFGKGPSPLGMRQEPSLLRSSGSAPGGVPAGGARSAAAPFGVPPAGTGGRGQGPGPHRVPAYLIDKRNGEEVIGPMPLVGPGVIGQWRGDGSADSRPDRPAGSNDPQVRSGRPPR
ncbi:WXG100 family type VII secretion target [Tsukamurella serpentis]